MTIQTFTAGQRLTALQMNTLQASDFNFTRNVRNDLTYTFALSDKGKLVESTNAGAAVFTIANDSSVEFVVGDRIDVLLASVGSITISAASGVTLYAEGDITTVASAWTRLTLIKRAENSWVMTGTGMSIQTVELDDLAVTTAKIANLAVTTGKIVDDAVTGDKIADSSVASAHIVDGTIVNADVNASAAIALTKLATGTVGSVVVHNASGVPTATALSGDVTVNSSGVTAIGSGVIMDADINASAAIALSKLANATAGQVLLGTTTTGVVTATTVSGDVTITGAGVTAIGGTKVTNSMLAGSIDDTKLATISTVGKVSNSATTATEVAGNNTIVARDGSGNFAAGTATLTSASVSGRFDGTSIREAVIDSSVSASVVTADYSTGDIFYVGTAPASNFTVNLTNSPTDNGKAITVVIFVTQGATGYIPNAVQVASSAQTIKWANGTAPTPTSSSGKIDIFSFTFVRRSSAWTVFGSSNLGY